MIGTLLNAAGIVMGGIAGLTMTKPLSPSRQLALKGLLGVATVFVGLKMTVTSLGGSVWLVCKQLLIVVLALALGRLAGRLLRLQKFSNRLGQYAKERISKAGEGKVARFNDGLTTGALLFCVGPLATIGALHDGLAGNWEPLAVKAVMDGLATMAFVSTFGWGVMLAALPVVAYQGSVSLAAALLAPWLRQHQLLDAVNATGGLLVFCVALIVLELRKIEVTDYLPSLAVAPLLTSLFR
jgi:hypothetical protein